MTSSGSIGCPTLVTCGDAPAPIPATLEPTITRDAVVAWEDGRIVHAGPRSVWNGDVDEEHPGAILPGLVDCHTHLPFVGWRDDEFEARLSGATYRDLHGRGGGIHRSARLLAEASDEEVRSFTGSLLDEMLAGGTTAVELKTGYGLSV